MLAKCCSPNITEYFASIMLPGTTELLIIMELMATSLSDLVSTAKLLSQHTAHAKGYRIVPACACHLVHETYSISPAAPCKTPKLYLMLPSVTTSAEVCDASLTHQSSD